MKKMLKHVSVLLAMLLLCSAMMPIASAATIPAEGSVWKPNEAPAPNPGTSAAYPILIETAENGTVKTDLSTASAGTTVIITAVPKDGYALKRLRALDAWNEPISLKKVNDTQYTFVMPSCAVTVKAVFGSPVHLCPRDNTCPMHGFTDLNLRAWYHDGVHYCIEAGLMNGVGGNLFDPNGTTTRAMLVTVLWRLEGSPVVTAAESFRDVPAGQWYSDAIVWASAKKIVNGYGDGTFGPSDLITREQVAAIFHRYAAFKGGESHTGTAAAQSYLCSNWAKTDVSWAAVNGLLDEIGVDVTNMTAAASRAELATYLYRLVDEILL